VYQFSAFTGDLVIRLLVEGTFLLCLVVEFSHGWNYIIEGEGSLLAVRGVYYYSL
jgi:hypothetical protein